MFRVYIKTVQLAATRVVRQMRWKSTYTRTVGPVMDQPPTVKQKLFAAAGVGLGAAIMVGPAIPWMPAQYKLPEDKRDRMINTYGIVGSQVGLTAALIPLMRRMKFLSAAAHVGHVTRLGGVSAIAIALGVVYALCPKVSAVGLAPLAALLTSTIPEATSSVRFVMFGAGAVGLAAATLLARAMPDVDRDIRGPIIGGMIVSVVGTCASVRVKSPVVVMSWGGLLLSCIGWAVCNIQEAERAMRTFPTYDAYSNTNVTFADFFVVSMISVGCFA